MLSDQETLHTLDHSNDGYYSRFIPLNHPYCYLLDTRLNLFRSQDGWAIAAEILGYSPRGGSIELQIFYYGNCLINLEQYNGCSVNNSTVYPISEASYAAATAHGMLTHDATTLSIRGQEVALSHNKADYARAGIELVEFEPGSIDIQEAGRLLITEHQHLLRATDAELYTCIPPHLDKILVLDEWYHKDFTISSPKIMTEEDIRQAYDLNHPIGGLHGMSFETLRSTIRAQEERTNQQALQDWNENRPSSYETWQQLAKVLATGDPVHYNPTVMPTTHWSNWPESGEL